MRDRVFHRLSLVALGVLSVGLLGWPASTGAQTLGGITGIVGGTTTVLGDTGTLAAGSLDALYNEADSISASLVSADVPSARVIGYADEIVSESYLASVNLTIAGITITEFRRSRGQGGPGRQLKYRHRVCFQSLDQWGGH